MSTSSAAARIQNLRAEVVASIRSREPRDVQLAKADAYIAAIREYARASGRRLPIPNRVAVLRQLG